MTLGIPQLIMLGFTILGLGISLQQHGQPKKGNHSFFVQIIAVTINLSILYWGGFFG